MVALAIVMGLILVAVAVRLAIPVVQKLRLRSELRGDWFLRFEQEFRTYARASRAARDGEWRV